VLLAHDSRFNSDDRFEVLEDILRSLSGLFLLVQAGLRDGDSVLAAATGFDIGEKRRRFVVNCGSVTMSSSPASAPYTTFGTPCTPPTIDPDFKSMMRIAPGFSVTMARSSPINAMPHG
jgi:hypothetical protein